VGILTSIFRAGPRGKRVRLTEEDGFVGLHLPMTSFAKRDDGSIELRACGNFDGSAIGFSAELGGTWNAKALNDIGISIYWGTVELGSIGSESDAFVRVLSEVFGLPSSEPEMVTPMSAQAASLAVDPRAIESRPLPLKLFLNSPNEDRYAEVYLEIDVRRRVVQFHEKDPGYRANVLAALIASAGRVKS
jgi:hypothetical protein